jgi:iron(II)-dependent oxidoreductase
MGGDSAEETPKHRVWIDSFLLDKTEVTNRQYIEFVKATGHPKPPFYRDPDFNKPDHPVVGVSYYDAQSYAVWAGKRLPTEAEWEKASRGGIEGKSFPWGDESPNGKCNYAPHGDKAADGCENTAIAKSFTPNAYGLYNMAGNAWEWCCDFYSAEYYSASEEKNPNGPDSGYTRVLRGGSFLSINPVHLRCSTRLELKPFVQDRYYGFRCAKSI